VPQSCTACVIATQPAAAEAIFRNCLRCTIVLRDGHYQQTAGDINGNMQTPLLRLLLRRNAFSGLAFRTCFQDMVANQMT
jgi:hypothetical protein